MPDASSPSRSPSTTIPTGKDTTLPQVPQANGVGIEPTSHPLPEIPKGREPVESLYIHVPFCFHKCHYCDFYSIVDTRERQETFVARLMRELCALSPWGEGKPLRTVFVGGGTPTLLRADLWRDLLACLREHFDCSKLRRGEGEFTVECNPETASRELFEVLRDGGVTRISVGAQSFHPAHLKTLERWHDPENVGRAVELARGAGIERQSIDLIFAIPGQTLEDWDHDLRTALALGLDHLSCYALTFEPHTAMTARLARGEFPRADEDLEADMFEHTVRVLRAAGLDRYEVSNFAVPGRECAHNMVYWRQGQWLAAGPSASAHVGGHRWKNTPRLDDYLTRDIDGLAPFVDHEPPDARRALCECILTGLRTREGLDWQGLVRAGESLAPGAAERLDRVASRQHAMGCAQVRDGRLALTDSGFLVANRVILDLVRALDALR